MFCRVAEDLVLGILRPNYVCSTSTFVTVAPGAISLLLQRQVSGLWFLLQVVADLRVLFCSAGDLLGGSVVRVISWVVVLAEGQRRVIALPASADLSRVPLRPPH